MQHSHRTCNTPVAHATLIWHMQHTHSTHIALISHYSKCRSTTVHATLLESMQQSCNSDLCTMMLRLQYHKLRWEGESESLGDWGTGRSMCGTKFSAEIVMAQRHVCLTGCFARPYTMPRSMRGICAANCWQLNRRSHLANTFWLDYNCDDCCSYYLYSFALEVLIFLLVSTLLFMLATSPYNK